MFRVQLFRVKVFRKSQTSLFDVPFIPQLVLAETLREKPKAELRRGYTWHIGNVTALDRQGLYFALGRTTKSTIAQYDEQSGDFVEAEFPAAPYTHVFCDTAIELLGIVPKAVLAPTVKGIARQLQKLLNECDENAVGARFEIDPINDPDEFIAQLRDAHAVRRFAVTFGLPNPFDVEEQIQRPLERYLRSVEGQTGKTQVAGESLNVDILEEMARSAATSGNDAEATIVKARGSRPVKRKLKGNVATEVVESDLGTEDARNRVLTQIRAFYGQLRGRRV